MPPIQTDYGYSYQAGLQGQPYDLSPYFDATAVASVDIEFGLGLVLNTSLVPDNNRIGVKLPSASNDVFVGVAVLDRAISVNSGTPAGFDDLTTDEKAVYKAGRPIRLRRRGRIYVYSDQAVAPGDPVYLRYTVSSGGIVAGNFRKDGDTSKAAQLSGVQWGGKITAAGLVILELNLP